jgi:hypothetical protein
MSQTLSSQQVASRPIQALIIQPDSTYEVRTIEQDIGTRQELVGGCIEAVHTEWATLWCDEDGIRHERPTNDLATYLWWKLNPDMEGVDILRGTVFVTGGGDDKGDSLPVPDEVVQLFERLAQIRREHGGKE